MCESVRIREKCRACLHFCTPRRLRCQPTQHLPPSPWHVHFCSLDELALYLANCELAKELEAVEMKQLCVFVRMILCVPVFSSALRYC